MTGPDWSGFQTVLLGAALLIISMLALGLYGMLRSSSRRWR